MRLALTFLAIIVAPFITSGAAAESNSPKQVYSPWTKFCAKSSDGKETCLVGRDAHIVGSDGETVCGPLGSAVLIEPVGEATKTLRVTLPPNVAFQNGVRITIDQSPPIERPFARCFANGCMADHEGGAELVTQLKNGQALLIEGRNAAGQPIAVGIPLSGFSEAYHGPSTSPQLCDAQWKAGDTPESRRQAEERRRQQEEARKRLMEAQCGAMP